IVGELVLSLQASYEGDSVERLIGHAEAAVSEDIDEDDGIEALAAFVHLSNESDEFGCDLLGWLPPYPDAPARPIFLEVKSDQDRSFPLSTAEWERAGELRDSYAFLVVLRGVLGRGANDLDAVPRRMELLPDPTALLASGRIALTPDGWVVKYQPEGDGQSA